MTEPPDAFAHAVRAQIAAATGTGRLKSARLRTRRVGVWFGTRADVGLSVLCDTLCIMTDLPLSLPHLPLHTLEDLAVCARFIHEDRCSWMGDDTHPCTCGVPRAIRAAAAVWNVQVKPSADEHHSA